MCSFMANMCVSSCRYCVLVSVEYPVVILTAVFCVICSLLLFVSDASGDHMSLAAERPHKKYGSAILIKDYLNIMITFMK